MSSESLFLAKGKESYDEYFQRKINYTGFSALQGTWKTEKAQIEPTSLGDIYAYLDKSVFLPTVPDQVSDATADYQTENTKRKKSVKEHINQLTITFDKE